VREGRGRCGDRIWPRGRCALQLARHIDMVLVPEVVQCVSRPVVAAGGFSDGRSLVAALAMGAIASRWGRA